MSDIKLFQLEESVKELSAAQVSVEKELQSLIEDNMELFFGVRFLKSEYQITNGRMDSIGIDENNCPVIFEYKRSINENVINQGLFYLDWLLDHKADFKLLVIEKLGTKAADEIDWSMPCVICIANDFTRYDVHAVNQMQRNIKLVKYKKYEDKLVLFEHLNAPNVKAVVQDQDEDKAKSGQKTHVEKVASVPENIKRIYKSICEYIESLGDDIVANQLKFYIAYRKVQNIACIEIYNKQVIVNLRLNPETVELEEGFSRDMRGIGHFGTGDLQLIVKSDKDYKKSLPYIERAYQEN